MGGKKQFKIRGMDCAEEVNALKGTVGKLPGITNVDFNLIDGTMTMQCGAGRYLRTRVPGNAVAFRGNFRRKFDPE
jgi:copper chaperone CopZ